MKKIVTAGIAGFIIGLIVGIAIVSAPFSHNSKAVQYVENRLTHLIRYSYPNASVKVSNVKPLGKFYLITIRIQNGSKVLGSESLFMSQNGSLLFMNNPNCYMNLKELKVNIKPGNDPSIGGKNAKVVIIVFSDYLCPYCARFAEVEKAILEKFGDKVLFVHKDFPIHGIVAIKAAEAARCAGEQGKYWQYHNLLFENQQKWMENTSLFYTYAKELGLNITKFKECMKSDKYLQEIERDIKEGRKYGVTGTPTIFVNGWRINGYISLKTLTRIIEEELK